MIRGDVFAVAVDMVCGAPSWYPSAAAAAIDAAETALQAWDLTAGVRHVHVVSRRRGSLYFRVVVRPSGSTAQPCTRADFERHQDDS